MMPPTRPYQTTEALPAPTPPKQSTFSMQQKQSHKRKRDSPEHNGNSRPRTANGLQSSGGGGGSGGGAPSGDQMDNILLEESPEFANLAQHLQEHTANNNNVTPSTAADALRQNMPSLTVPQPTDLSFQSNNTVDDEDQGGSSFNLGADTSQNHHGEGAPYNLDPYTGDGPRHPSGAGAGSKPVVGSDEWHKVRRDNHKEVERRRRETINEGINELAKIVPGCDKNKGAILQRGVQYITQLKDNEKKNIEKWTLEKMLTDQAISELSLSVDKLKEELSRAHKDAAKWKKRCQDNGLAKDGEAGGGGGGVDSDGDSLMDGK